MARALIAATLNGLTRQARLERSMARSATSGGRSLSSDKLRAALRRRKVTGGTFRSARLPAVLSAMYRTTPLWIACLVLTACAEEAREPEGEPPYAIWPEPLALFPHGPEQTENVCERSGDDLVRDVFCGPEPAEISSLSDLHAAFGLDLSTLGGINGV